MVALALGIVVGLAMPGLAMADEPRGDANAVALAGDSPASAGRNSSSGADESGLSKVAMRQGAGEAKGYDSISAALVDVADYSSSSNKEAYVITLNSDISENVTIPANKKVTIDLNGKRLSSVDLSSPALTVQSKYATLRDGNGLGRIDVFDAAIQIEAGAKLTVSGGLISSEMGRAIVNDGTLMMTGGNVEGRGISPIINNGTATISGGHVKSLFTAIENQGKLTVKGGRVETVEGGPAILTQGAGSLTVSGGEIPAAGDVVVARDTSSVTVTGGTMDGNNCGIRAYNAAKINISGGVVGSFSGCALSAENEAVATISGGEFRCAAGSKAIERTPAATVTLSGGTFNVTSASDVCDSPTFVDRYGAVERDGKVYVEMTRPAAVVIAEDGSQTAYESFTKACSNAPAYSTVKLMEDAVLGKYAAEVKQYGVTVDLNGFNIDGTGYTGGKAALTLGTKYGAEPVDGKDSTLRLVNGKPGTGGKVTGKLPVAGKAGDSSFEVPVFIGEEVELAVANGGADKVKLESSAYLVYTEKAASYFSNGGFKADATDGTLRIYGEYSGAAKHAPKDSAVLMLNDYTGSDSIHSGNRVATLDLGGHTYTYTGAQQVIDINYNDAGIILKNGKVVATQALTQAGVAMLHDNGTLTMDHVVMDISGDSWGIGTNGTNVNNTVVLKDSTLNVPEGLGIYFPSTGSVTIDNSIINAKHFGVQMCAGSLTVTGGKTAITVTGAPQPKTEGDGPIIDGAAVSIVEREGYRDLAAVEIKGGIFTAADSSKSVKTYAFNNTDRVEGDWPDAGSVVSVSGGRFSHPIDEGICTVGFGPQKNADGTYGVHEHKFTVSHSDAESHWAECEVCGAMGEKQPHGFEWIIDKDATATNPGSKHEECSACGYSKGAVEIPATGTTAPDEGGADNENRPSAGKPFLPSTGDASLAVPLLLAAAAGVSASVGVASRGRRAR